MPNYLALVFYIWHDSLHRLRSYCWETAHRSFASHSCRKICALDRKTIVAFLMVLTFCITMQSLGKIVLRAPAVGAKMWCLCVCYFVKLRVRRPVRSRGYNLKRLCVTVYASIFMLFWPFFLRDCLSDVLDISYFCRYMAPQFSQNCSQSKNRRKSLCAPLRIDSLEIWIKFHCSRLG